MALLLSVASCSGAPARAGGGDNSELHRRLERQIRAQFNIPPNVGISFGERKASEFDGYDNLQVLLVNNDKKTAHDFLISKDGKTLVRMAKFDVSTDPWAEAMKKIDVTGRPVRGNKDAKVTVAIFDDFQCPFCARMHGTLFPGILKDYAGSVRFIYKDYPLGNHPWAMRAAVNANCLAEQNNDAYWEFADFVHANQRVISETKAAAGSEQPGWQAGLDRLTADFGARHRLDAGRLQACVAAQDETAVRASMEEGNTLGVNATPTLFINGQKVEGAIPAPDLRNMLDAALREAGETVPARAASAPSGQSK